MSERAIIAPPLAVAAVLLRCDDPARLAAFYREQLGLPLVHMQVEGLEAHWACEIQHVYFSIWPLAGDDQPRAAASAPPSAPRAGLALYVDDLEQTFARLSALGLTVCFAPRRTPLGTIARLVDPAGHLLELYRPL